MRGRGQAARHGGRTATALLAAAVAAVLSGPAPLTAEPAAAPSESLQLTLDQARGLARAAYRDGEIALANKLAWALWEADHNDVAALILLAATEPLLGRAGQGVRAGRDAWRATDVPGLRHEAAFYAARAALFDDRYVKTQFWLRRAWDTAKTEDQRAVLAHDFQRVRAMSPFTARAGIAVAPSSNLNGGSQWDWLLIDDTWIVGPLSGSAQALSGWRASIWGDFGLRVTSSEKSTTTLGVTAYHSFNFLSEDARALAPDVENGDLDQLVLGLYLDHRRDATGTPWPDHLRLGFSHSWYGGATLGSDVYLEIGRGFDWGDGRHRLDLSVEIDRVWNENGEERQRGFGGDIDYSFSFSSGTRLRFGLGGKEIRADFVDDAYVEGEARLGVDFARPLGPAQVSVNLSYRARDYDTFYVGPFPSPNGRQDHEVSASLDFKLTELDYLGFSPVISLTASQTTSNITRYETQSFGVAFGFQSNF